MAEDGTDGTGFYSPADVVRELFERVGGGVPLITLEKDLNSRRVPSPTGRTWSRVTIRQMVLNPAYIGKRVFRGEVVGDGMWDGLVNDEDFWACARLLGDPTRTTTRPGRAMYLLSYIAECGKCGAHLQANRSRSHSAATPKEVYKCVRRACAAIERQLLDEYAERVVVAWLSREDVYKELTAGQNDEEVTRARAEAQRLRTRLEEWRQIGERDELDPVSVARMVKATLAGIAEAEARAADAGVPPVLRGRIGPEALSAWQALGDDVAVKREIIRLVAQIKLFPAGRGRTDWSITDENRLQWRWKFGADDD